MSADDAFVGIEKFFAGKRDASLDGDRRPGEGLA